MLYEVITLRTLIYDQIHNIEGIIQTQTSIIVNYEKDNYSWGTIFEENLCEEEPDE